MKGITAYMLAVVGGHDTPDVASVKKILSAVGIDLDGDDSKKLEDLVEEMSAKDLAEVMKAGLEKLKTVPAAVAAAVAVTQPAALLQQLLWKRRRKRRRRSLL